MKPTAEALHSLAIAAFQAGNYEAAAAYLGQAIHLNCANAVYHNNLGLVLRMLGRGRESAACFRRAIRFRPGYAEAHLNLGHAFEAEGRPADTAACCREALRWKPEFPEAWLTLSAALNDQERFEEAAEASREALALRPGYAEAVNNLGTALARMGRLDEAAGAFETAIGLKPEFARAHGNLAAVLVRRGAYEQAEACCRRSLALNGASAASLNNLGAALHRLGQLGPARVALEDALRLEPECAEAHANLGAVLMDQGRAAEAAGCLRRAAALAPAAAATCSNLLLALNYDPAADPCDVAAEHQRWAQAFEAPLAPFRAPHPNRPDPDRPLRVGYVSPDFRAHAVAFFVEGFLAAHTHGAFEITCYASVARPDAVTQRLRCLGHRWRDILGLTDEEAADLVRHDGIDILVDLAGHTRDNRLLLFARKPAPVAVTYLGYPNTTGLSSIDYRLTDSWADPPGLVGQVHTEELERLPRTFLCYTPPEDVPAAAAADRAFTLGCFNNTAKLNADVVTAWSDILRRAPHAELLLKSAALADPETCGHFHAEFQRHGIDRQRVRMLGRVQSERDHLALYAQVDLALDPFPYNGTTTTCEALWLGVPVLSLAGRGHAGRVGVSLLTAAGLSELIAGSVDDYIARAERLAANRDVLAGLRAGLRDRVERSALADGPGLARALEDAYRRMWRRWCEQHG